jgi:hypothetical protein
MRHMLTIMLLAGLTLSYPAYAEEEAPPPPPKKSKDAPAGPPQPGLTGAVLPHCDPGKYPANMQCKPSPPNFYAPAGAKFPVPCPTGKSSPYGSRSANDCK